MAFSDFTYPDAIGVFDLREDSADLFAGVADVPAGPALRAIMPNHRTLTTLINTEKARSELLVAPVLSELWGRANGRINLFSGVEFQADPEAGLTGFVDFLLGRGPQLPRVSAPVVVLFGAKRDNIADGYGQCIAGMVGAMRFDRRCGIPVDTVYGGVTTGVNWKFLRLAGTTVTFDQPEYTIDQLDRILGILTHMVGPAPAPVAAA
jgi:hypothetical protein